MAEAGATDVDQWIRKASKVWVSTDKMRCPAATVESRNLLAEVRKAIAEAPANAESKIGEVGNVLVDGGQIERVIFSARDLTAFSYTNYIPRGPVSDAITKLKTAIAACKN